MQILKRARTPSCSDYGGEARNVGSVPRSAECSSTVGECSATVGECILPRSGRCFATVGECSATVGEMFCHGGRMFCLVTEMFCHGGRMFCHGGGMFCHGGGMFCHGGGMLWKYMEPHVRCGGSRRYPPSPIPRTLRFRYASAPAGRGRSPY